MVGQELTAQGGHAVIFREEDGQLKADVKVNTHPGFSKSYIDLEVVLEQNTDLARLPYLHKKLQERHIYLQLATTNKPAKVIIYKEAGAMGGMKEGDKGKTKRKAKKNKSNTKTERSPSKVISSAQASIHEITCPLHTAVINWDIPTVHSLLKRNINVNQKGEQGNTVLHLAIKQITPKLTNRLQEIGLHTLDFDQLDPTSLQYKAINVIIKGYIQEIIEPLIKKELIYMQKEKNKVRLCI